MILPQESGYQVRRFYVTRSEICPEAAMYPSQKYKKLLKYPLWKNNIVSFYLFNFLGIALQAMAATDLKMPLCHHIGFYSTGHDPVGYLMAEKATWL